MAFVSLRSRTYGGMVSLAVDDLALIGPARIHRSGGSHGSNETLECVAILTTGAEIALTGSQEAVLAAIADASTFVPPSIVDTLTAQVEADTGALGVAVQQVQATS